MNDATPLVDDASPLVDPSCYHAAVAALLRSADPAADPALVLGSGASTCATWDTDGLLAFAEPFVPFSAMAERRGHRLVEHPVRDRESWLRALRHLERGHTVVAAADGFHLTHFWPNRGRSHALHAVVVSDPDPVTGTLRLLDPGLELFHDGRVPLAEIEAAMCGEEAGQSWMELLPRTAAPLPHGDLIRYELTLAARELAGGEGGFLGGVEFLEGIRSRLAVYVELVAERPRGATGNELNWGAGQNLLLGLWWYHNVLRWFARYLGALADDGTVPLGPEPAASADQACRDVLVVRNLLMRLGVMPPDSPRARTFREQIGTRLGTARDALAATSARLATAAGAPA
ncbi:hypothetical protein [Streptomyces sp. enrichment culture]|uniref:hypothetical protein n=1 Tax=Streptomyces sp. enrichment culture TaxID=1795815 RepID=UPI003F575489